MGIRIRYAWGWVGLAERGGAGRGGKRQHDRTGQDRA